MSAADTQVAGDHYVDQPIQPLYFAMINGWDPAATKILKYITRHRRKNGVEDLRKALHVLQIRREIKKGFLPDAVKSMVDPSWDCIESYTPCTRISMTDYIRANNIHAKDVDALYCLELIVLYRHYNHYLHGQLEFMIAHYEEMKND